MRWIAAILMILNVGVYLWAGGQHIEVDEPSTVSKPDVNMEGMLLLNEIGNQKHFGNISGSKQPVSVLIEPNYDQVNQEPPEPETTVEDVQDDQPVITSLAEDAILESRIQQSADDLDDIDEAASGIEEASVPVESTQADVQLCYRLGPFKKEESWQAATQWMEQKGYEFRQITSESRELRAVRVYLGPFDSVISAQSSVSHLKEKNLDHFVYLVDNEQPRISLGYFTQEELAEKFVTYLKSIDVDAKSQPEYRKLGPFNWMEIPVASVDQDQVSTHNWIEPAVDFSKVEC